MAKPSGLNRPQIGERGAKVGVYGQFGTGKTELVMTAVEVGHLLLVDAEGRSQYYDPEAGYGFEVIYSKDVNRAVELLKYAEELHAKGEKVVFAIDGFSSMWFEQQEVAARAGKTSAGTAKFSSWATAKKPLKDLYALLYETPVDCIITMRSKPKYQTTKSGTPIDLEHDKPDTERGINYAVDLVVEMQKDELKPGTPLKGENFHAVVVKTSGPKEDNPIPIGTKITDPSFSKLLGLRLKGARKLKIEELNENLETVQSYITTAKDFEWWIVSIGMDKATVFAHLKEKYGHGYKAELLQDYVKDVWEMADFPQEKMKGKKNGKEED